MIIQELRKYYSKELSNFAILGKQFIFVFLLIIAIIMTIYYFVLIKFNFNNGLILLIHFAFLSFLILSFNRLFYFVILKKYKIKFAGYKWQDHVDYIQKLRLIKFLDDRGLYTESKIDALIDILNLSIETEKVVIIPFSNHIITFIIAVFTIVTTVKFTLLTDLKALPEKLTNFTMYSVTAVLVGTMVLFFINLLYDLVFNTEKFTLKDIRKALYSIKLEL